MDIRAKLTLGFVGVALTVAVGGYVSLVMLERASLQSAGESLADHAALAMSEIDEDIWDRVEELRLYVGTTHLAEAVAESNEQFDKMPNARGHIESVDAAWSAGENTPFIEEILGNDLSRELRDYLEHVEAENGYEVLAEIYLTNRHGAVVATSGRTTDYLQADEDWYQAAIIAEQRGWIGDVHYDDSAAAFSVDLVVPLRDDDLQLVGVLKGVLSIAEVERALRFVETRSSYRSARVYLIDPDGRAVLSGRSPSLAGAGHDLKLEDYGEDLSADPEVARALAAGEGFHVFSEEGEKKLAVFCRSKNPPGRRGPGWTLLAEYNTADVLEGVHAAERWLLIASLAITALALLVGVLFSRTIADPIRDLTEAASAIAEGRTHRRVEDRGRKDEVGILSRTFNRMAEDLTVFRRLAEASSQGFGMSDLEGRVTYANTALCRLLGAEGPEDLLGKDFKQFGPEEIREHLEKVVLPTVLREGQWVGELPVLAKDGTLTPTLQYPFLIRDDDGNPLCLADVISDITEIKEAENALREKNEELEAIYDGMVDGLLIADMDTKRFVRANRSVCAMLGYSEEELLTKSIMDVHPPEDLPQVLKKVEARKEGRIAIEEGIPVLRKDGSVFYADIAARQLTYLGRPCVVGLFRDITERREAREKLRREHETLLELLKAHDHERRLISYDIHDGVAQRLTAAMMHFQSCKWRQEQAAEETPGGCRMAHQLLAESLAEARRLFSGVRPPILDESGVIDAIRDLVQENARPEGPEIEFHTKVAFDRLEPVLENALYRIAQEGLTNACQHSTSDKVRVAIVQQDETVRIEVADSGVGFDPQQVTEKWFGIAGIRERVRLLGGQADIETAPGKGTRIVVELPLKTGVA